MQTRSDVEAEAEMTSRLASVAIVRPVQRFEQSPPAHAPAAAPVDGSDDAQLSDLNLTLSSDSSNSETQSSSSHDAPTAAQEV